MSLDNAKNFAKVTVSTGYDAVATTIVLTTGHGAKLPTAPFNAVWWNATDFGDPADDPNAEIVRVTNISTDTLTVTRAQESTSAATHNTSAKTYKMMAGLTAKVINTDLAGGLTKASPYLTDGTHYYIPHMMYQAVTPDNVTFAWNNQGSADELRVIVRLLQLQQGVALVAHFGRVPGIHLRARRQSLGRDVGRKISSREFRQRARIPTLVRRVVVPGARGFV
jgi:hypothetical protein